MREIKFRAYHFGANYSVKAEMLYDEKLGDVLNWKQQGQDLSDVMQYTGLKDKNGVDIYEGDIVKASSQGLSGTFEIIWRQEGSPCWILYPAWQNKLLWSLDGEKRKDGHYYDDVEIIGNIYENPELLEREDEA